MEKIHILNINKLLRIKLKYIIIDNNLSDKDIDEYLAVNHPNFRTIIKNIAISDYISKNQNMKKGEKIVFTIDSERYSSNNIDGLNRFLDNQKDIMNTIYKSCIEDKNGKSINIPTWILKENKFHKLDSDINCLHVTSKYLFSTSKSYTIDDFANPEKKERTYNDLKKKFELLSSLKENDEKQFLIIIRELLIMTSIIISGFSITEIKTHLKSMFDILNKYSDDIDSRLQITKDELYILLSTIIFFVGNMKNEVFEQLDEETIQKIKKLIK